MKHILQFMAKSAHSEVVAAVGAVLIMLVTIKLPDWTFFGLFTIWIISCLSVHFYAKEHP